MSKTVSSGASLTLKDIDRFMENAGAIKNGMTLVAPNAEIAKQWSKQYPHYTILLSAKYLPTNPKPKEREK